MKRKTIQRALTLRAVQTMQSHPTADEVYEAVSAEHPNISRGTVYRNLNQLSEDGEIREMEVPGGADRAAGSLMWIWIIFPIWRTASKTLMAFSSAGMI